MCQGDLNVELSHLALLIHLSYLLHLAFLYTNLAFHYLPNVSELVPTLTSQAILMDEVVPFIIDEAGSEGRTA